MAASKQCVFFLVVCLLGLAGCASPQAVYGDRARFSPAFHGYVMAKNDGSDDPAKDETVLLLRDPVTGKKLLCREDVVEWRELHEDLAMDDMHDHRAAIAAAVTTSVVFGSIAGMEPLGGLAVLEGISVTQNLYDLLRTKNAPELLAAGVALFDRERFSQSSLFIERALAKDSAVGVQGKAFYYLGLAYVEQGKRARAGTALTAYLDKAAVRDVDSYRKAESTLASLGVRRKACASTEPVDLHW